MKHKVFVSMVLAVLGASVACGDDDDDPTPSATSSAAATTATPREGSRSTAYPAMVLASNGFEDGGAIPEVYTCDGDNTSPPLEWTAAPSKARAFVLIMHDPDARAAGGFTHWVLYDLPVGTAHLDEGMLPPGTVEGKNGRGANGYTGPCPPSGDQAHHYEFHLYALDISLGIGPGKTKAEVEAAMKNHILSDASLTGLYARKK
jgi:Raf kinase inhibitor-like YbhB/YbcL family protein